MNFEKFEKVRNDQFPMTAQCAYLDTSSSGMVSKNAKEVMVRYIEDRYAEGLDIAGINANWTHADGLRETVAKMFNADSDKIFFGILPPV